MDRRRAAGALLALAACIACSTAAPMASNTTALDLYDGAPEGCYYNFQHYGEGDRIMTNEPCLNCTCHNRMLMCYLRVCPFTKPIGQDCTVEKRADQCCPIVTCPDVPVDLLTSTSTSSPAEYGATGIGKQDKYGCSIDGRYFSEGSKVPPTPNKPCEHCYCIRNMTTCVMQECTLHVDGCVPIYHKDVCCPVRYSCDHPEDEIPLLDDMTTTVRPTPGFLLTTTTLTPVTQVSQDCVHDDQIFADGALIKTEKACEHCYCMKGDIVCVVQECGTPMENEGKNCTSLPPRHGQCCPDTYICEGDELTTDQTPELTTEIVKMTSTTPPRRVIEGSGYRNEPDEPYTEGPIFDTLEIEGSGEEQSTVSIESSEKKLSETETPDLADEMFLTTAKEHESKTYSSTTEQDMIDIMVSKSEPSSSEETPISEYDIVTGSTKEDNEEEKITDSLNKDVETTPFDVEDNIVTQAPLLTTANVYVSTSSSDLLTNEDQFVKTTDSSLKKEDYFTTVPDVTDIQQMHEEITTKNYYYEPKVTKDEGDQVSVTSAPISFSKDDSNNVENTSVHTDIEEVFQSKQTTTDILTETEKAEKDSTDENIFTSTVKIESLETSSLSNKENEIDEDLSLISPTGRIPGEGDCLLNGITYRNKASVPTTNKCHTSCQCVNSIVTCDPIICSPPPEYTNMNNCQPMYDSSDSCCPTYICDHLKETVLPESHSQMSGTESPKQIHDNECSGNECQVVEDKQSFEPSQTTISSHSNQPSDTKIPCDENAECQVTAVKPCEGDNCKIQPEVVSKDDTSSLEDKEPTCKDGICVQTSSPKYEDQDLEKECNHDSCRRKESSDVESKPPTPCSGQQCESLPGINEILKESSSQLPVTSEEVTKLTSSSDHYTFMPTEKLTTLSEETLSTHISSNKIDSELQDFTTKHSEILTEVTNSGVVQEFEPFTSVKPDVEKLPEYSSDKTIHIISSTTLGIENEQQSITTSPLDISTEPSVSEDKIDNLITTETEKEITSKTEKLSTAYPGSLETTSQENTLSDDEKVTVVETLDENLTPVLNENTNAFEPYTTESLIHVKDTVKDSSELPAPTLTNDNEQATESVQSKDDSTSTLFTESSTRLPEYHGLEEKLSDESTLGVTEKTVQYSGTTESIDSLIIESKDKYTTQGSKTSMTSVDYEVTTEYIKMVETLEVQPTEETLKQMMPESSSQVNDMPLTEENEISTASVIPKHESDDSVFATKVYTTEKDVLSETEKIQEELFTETPVIDVMESLNGRGTEIPSKDVNEELSTVTSQTEAQTSVSKVSDIDESQPEITITEKPKLTTQTSYEQERETKTSVLFDTETMKIVTDAPIFDTTALTSIKEITTEENNDINNNGKVTTLIPEPITTVRLDVVDDNQKEQDIDGKTESELLSETTLKPDKSSEPTESKEISSTASHITQSLSTEPSSLLTEYNLADVHEIEVSTSGFEVSTPVVGTEIITETSDDITKKPQGQEAEEKYHLSTSTQILEFTDTPDLSVSTTKPVSEDILHESLPQQETTATVIDNLSTITLTTSSSAGMNKFITDSVAEEVTTKLEDTSSNKPEVTTKEFESEQIVDLDKTTLSSLGSESSYPKHETTENYLVLEDEDNKKTTITYESFATEKSTKSYVDVVTDEVTGSPYVEDTKLKTETPEFTTAKVSEIESETFTVKQPANKESDQVENITEESEKTKLEQHHTEPQSITDGAILGHKDEITERIDSITPTEKTEHKISETTDKILKETEVPNIDITENLFTEKSKHTTHETPEINEIFEENTINNKQTEVINEYTTESLVKVTEIEDDNNKEKTVLPDVPATDEYTDKTLSPEMKYTQKSTETPEISEFTQDNLTGAPEILKTTEASAIKDSDSSTDESNEAITMPELYKESTVYTTEPSNVHESEKDINLSEQKVTENEADENIVTVTTIRSTEKSTESYISNDEETSLPTLVNELTTDTPHLITEGVIHSQIKEDKHKVPEVSTEIISLTSKLIDYTIEETKGHGINQDQTTGVPSISTYLPERTTDNIGVAVSDENHTERSTELQEPSTSKFSEGVEEEEVDRNEITTKSPETFTTSKSSEELSVPDQTKTTELSQVIDNEKTSESILLDNYITEKITTVKTMPEQSTDILSISYQTSSKPELIETISEDQLPITVKVNVDNEDNTLAYTTAQYTETRKEMSTDLQDGKTQKYAPTTHSADEYLATTIENDQTFSQKYHDYTTQPETLITHKSETETQPPLSLSTEKQSYLTTEISHVSDGQIGDTPDNNKYTTKQDDTSTTELPSSIITSRVEYSKPSTETKDEYTDTTPYLVELEEHTHKGAQEVTSEIYHEMEISTVKYDTSFSEKDKEGVTTQQQDHLDHETQTDSAIKETVAASNEDIEVTTSVSLHDDVDVLHTTRTTHDVFAESSTQFEKLTTPSSLLIHIDNENIHTTSILSEMESTTNVPEVTTTIYEKKETPKQEELSIVTEKEKENDEIAHTPFDSVTSAPETITSDNELISALTNKTTTKSTEDATTLAPTQFDKFTRPEDKPSKPIPTLSTSEEHKPDFNEMLPTDDIPSTDEENHFPPTGSSGYGQEPDYGEEDQAFGPGTCRYGGKVYVSAQQIPRDDPCDFCFCFRSDIICLQQSCPPPIHGCHEEPIQGFCCPRYECPVSMAMTLNVTTTTTTTTTTLPPHFLPHAYKGAAQRRGCQIKGHTYKVGEVVRASSGPCLHCTCGGDGQMKCDPKACTPEPILRQMIAAAVSARRRR